ncbi:MAG: hypothetical protein FWH03_05875 [Firmicutes bacterium]|nr:hypothetical protein [Bacillota bacterium]
MKKKIGILFIVGLIFIGVFGLTACDNDGGLTTFDDGDGTEAVCVHEFEWVSATPARCGYGEANAAAQFCIHCNAIGETWVGEVLEHEWVLEYETLVCSRCGETKTRKAYLPSLAGDNILTIHSTGNFWLYRPYDKSVMIITDMQDLEDYILFNNQHAGIGDDSIKHYEPWLREKFNEEFFTDRYLLSICFGESSKVTFDRISDDGTVYINRHNWGDARYSISSHGPTSYIIELSKDFQPDEFKLVHTAVTRAYIHEKNCGGFWECEQEYTVNNRVSQSKVFDKPLIQLTSFEQLEYYVYSTGVENLPLWVANKLMGYDENFFNDKALVLAEVNYSIGSHFYVLYNGSINIQTYSFWSNDYYTQLIFELPNELAANTYLKFHSMD